MASTKTSKQYGHHFGTPTFWDCQLCFYVRISFVSETRLKGFSPWASIEAFGLENKWGIIKIFETFKIFEIYKIFEIFEMLMLRDAMAK